MEESKPSFSLELLPSLAVEVIAKYLSAQDLAACCAVNRGVRQLFDDDLVWKPRCQQGLAEYLLETPCRVEPYFESPEITDSGLTIISGWRLAFMAENHLWNNVRQGKYTKDNFDYPYGSKFQTNDSLLIEFEDQVEIVDIRQYPAVSLVPPIPKCRWFNYDFSFCNYEPAETAVVALCGKCVQVYQLNYISKEWFVKHTFYFDETQKLLHKTSDEALQMFKSECETGCCPFGRLIIVDNFFIGFFLGETSMHIWNVQTGTKLKEEQCFGIVKKIEYFRSNGRKDLFIAVTQESQYTVTYLAYSLSNLTFFPFKVVKDGLIHSLYTICCVFKDYVVIMTFSGCLDIYNYQNSETVVSNITKTSNHKILKNNLLLIQSRSLKLFNTDTREFDTLMERVKWFEVLLDKFLLVECFYESGLQLLEVGDSLKIVFNEKGRMVPFSFIRPLCVCFRQNGNYTRCIARLIFACVRDDYDEYDGFMLHFW